MNIKKQKTWRVSQHELLTQKLLLGKVQVFSSLSNAFGICMNIYALFLLRIFDRVIFSNLFFGQSTNFYASKFLFQVIYNKLSHCLLH